MSTNTAVVIGVVLKAVFTTLVFGTTAYAVFWLGHSGWWFVLAFVVAATTIDSIEPNGRAK